MQEVAIAIKAVASAIDGLSTILFIGIVLRLIFG